MGRPRLCAGLSRASAPHELQEPRDHLQQLDVDVGLGGLLGLDRAVPFAGPLAVTILALVAVSVR